MEKNAKKRLLEYAWIGGVLKIDPCSAYRFRPTTTVCTLLKDTHRSPLERSGQENISRWCVGERVSAALQAHRPLREASPAPIPPSTGELPVLAPCSPPAQAGGLGGRPRPFLVGANRCSTKTGRRPRGSAPLVPAPKAPRERLRLGVRFQQVRARRGVHRHGGRPRSTETRTQRSRHQSWRAREGGLGAREHLTADLYCFEGNSVPVFAPAVGRSRDARGSGWRQVAYFAHTASIDERIEAEECL